MLMKMIFCRQNSADKLCKNLESQLTEANSKIDELTRNCNTISSQKTQLDNQNKDVLRQIDDAESQINQLTKAKQAMAKQVRMTRKSSYRRLNGKLGNGLVGSDRLGWLMFLNLCAKFQFVRLFLDFNLTVLVQLEEAKTALEEETRARTKLHGELRNVQSELEHARDQLDDEQEGKAELQRSLTKAMSEASSWRQKYESGEGGIRSVWNCKVRLLLSTDVSLKRLT